MSLALGSTEFYSLGFGEPLPVSSEHNRGMDVLLEKINQLFNDSSINKKQPISREDIVRISILGRPNSGKSTLTNYFLNETRQIVAEEAGITRDSIAFPFLWKKVDYEIWDTAGLRKRAKVNDFIERLASKSSLNAVKQSNISILIIDALVGFDRQDANIANFIEDTGRPFVVAVNKWDLVKDKNILKKGIKEKTLSFLPQLGNIPIINISAKSGKGVGQLMIKINNLVKLNNIRIQTNKLNKFLEKIEIYHPHPNQNGREVRLKYITQISTNPPSFLLFSNRPSSVLDSYKRYLINNLRKEFDLEGIPLKIDVRSSKNPYTNL
jgi:GTP-binding protein